MVTRKINFSMGSFARHLTLVLICLSAGGCLKNMAINALGKALASGSSTYATDDDPELVGASLPFALKTLESLIASSPNNVNLLTAACSGFTQYAKVYVEYDADYIEEDDYARARHQRQRARRLYVRALEYGLRGLEACGGVVGVDDGSELLSYCPKKATNIHAAGA